MYNTTDVISIDLLKDEDSICYLSMSNMMIDLFDKTGNVTFLERAYDYCSKNTTSIAIEKKYYWVLQSLRYINKHHSS